MTEKLEIEYVGLEPTADKSEESQETENPDESKSAADRWFHWVDIVDH